MRFNILHLGETNKQNPKKKQGSLILKSDFLPLSFPLSVHLPQGWLSVQPQTSGEQPGRVLLQPDRHPVQPGGLPAGVRSGPERAADLPLHAQEEHGAAGAPPAAQGEEEPGGGSLRPAQRLHGSDRGGLGLPGRAGGRRRPGGGGGGGGWRRWAQRVPGDAAGSVHPRPLERALVQPSQPSELRDHGVIVVLTFTDTDLFTLVWVSPSLTFSLWSYERKKH